MIEKRFRGIIDHERWATKDRPAAEEAAEAAEALGDKAGEAAAAAAQAMLDAGKSVTAAREAGKAAAKAAASGESIADAIKDGYSAGKVTDAARNAGMSREAAIAGGEAYIDALLSGASNSMVREAAEAAVSSVEAALARGESPEQAMAYGSEEGAVVVDAIEVGGEAAMAALKAELGPAAVAAASRAASEAIKEGKSHDEALAIGEAEAKTMDDQGSKVVMLSGGAAMDFANQHQVESSGTSARGFSFSTPTSSSYDSVHLHTALSALPAPDKENEKLPRAIDALTADPTALEGILQTCA